MLPPCFPRPAPPTSCGSYPTALPMSLPSPNVIPAANKPRSTCRAPAFQRGEPAVRLTPAPMPNRPNMLFLFLFGRLLQLLALDGDLVLVEFTCTLYGDPLVDGH